jgi:diguanylate cyclase (GGDEF)-like protein
MTLLQRIPSIRSRLALLIAACILPAAMMAAVLIVYDYNRARDQMVDNTVTTARAIASLVDKDFARTEATLRALATSPALDAGDFATFSRQAQEAVVSGTAHHIVLTDTLGKPIINTRHASGSSGSKTWSASQLRLLAESNGPVISPMSAEIDSEEPAIALGIPVSRDGKHLYNLNAILFPKQISALLVQQQLPPDWIAAIIDGNGVIVARSHEAARFVGRKATADLRNAIAMDSEGSFEGKTSEGTSVLAAFSRSAVANWTVAIGIPSAAITSRLRTTIGWLALGTIALLSSSLGLAWRIGGNIAQSIRGLSGPALALGSGKEVSIPPLRLREADEVARALHKASQMLQLAEHRANHDSLTGLANRSLFREIANQQLLVCQRESTHLAFLYIDLDDFKTINDTEGHAAGDELLRQVGERLRERIRGSDVAARLGGDEFAVLLIGASRKTATAVAEALMNSLSAPFTLESDVEISISASIGVATFPESGNSTESLLSLADVAMYQAKEAGKQRATFAGRAQA